MIASVYPDEQSRWTTTRDVPLRPDLRWAIEARVHAIRANARVLWTLAWTVAAALGVVLAVLASGLALPGPLVSQTAQTAAWFALGAAVACGGSVFLAVVRRVREQQRKLRSLERDLADGVHVEIVTDVEYHPGRTRKDRDAPVIGGQMLVDQQRYDRAAITKLRGLSPLHDAFVCYSPHAQMLLEIVTADGVLVYRPPELIGPN